MKIALVISLVICSVTTFAYDGSYYPDGFHEMLESKTLARKNIINLIHQTLSKAHKVCPFGGNDTIVNNCSNGNKCFRHKKLSYKTARKYLFGKLHLKRDEKGNFYIKDVYCKKKYTRQTRRIGNVGPMLIPNSNIINCEHTWPKSRFSTHYEYKIQEGDLHHLFPTDNIANSTRSSLQFAEVNSEYPLNLCDNSSIGEYLNIGTKSRYNSYFEPPNNHKGNVARALFYFSIRYQVMIQDKEEIYLRKWHLDDPVDAQEIKRNRQIMEIQNNRNPFIDFPALVEKVQDF